MKSQMIIHPDELSRAHIDRFAKTGVDCLGIHPVGGVNAAKSLAELVALMKTEGYRELIDYAKRQGLSIEYELHAAGYLLPRALFELRPDYFRMNESGERTPDYNFCVSNGEALSLFAKNAAKLAASLYGSEHNFYFWLDDGRDIHCRCEKCRSLSPSDQQIIALNAMHREIKKLIPDAKCAYLAYVDTVIPPTLEADEGIFLEYAPFEKYTAKGENAPELIARELEMTVPLMKCFSSFPPKVLEYWYDNSLFSGWKKPPARFSLDIEAMRRDIERYSSLGFSYISTFACFLGEDYAELYSPVDFSPFADACKKA